MRIIILLSLLLSAFFLPAQTSDLIVSDITFSGLKKTKSSYLFRFLKTQKDTVLNEKTLERDIQVLKNLYSVANAAVALDTTENRVAVTFQIQEALTLFPIVNFGGVEGNFWFQLGFTDVNWLGKGNQLTAYYLNNDRRHNAALYYRVPYWGGSKWGSSFSFLRWASVEPTYFDEGTVVYNYAFTSYGASGIYEIKNDHTIEFGGSYFTEEYAKLPEQELLNPPGPDDLVLPKLLFKVNHRISRINYHFFYQEGWDNTTQTESVYNIEGGNWFHVFKNDFRYFKRVNKFGNLAFRARVGLSTNIRTPFAPFVLDSQTNIRGAGNRRDRGTGVLTLNAEYRHTIYDGDDWESGRNARKGKSSERDNDKYFAAQIVGFTDIGSWRSPGGNFSDFVSKQETRFFAGGGIRLIYKKAYNAILRVDYGVDILNPRERGLVLGLGQYF